MDEMRFKTPIIRGILSAIANKAIKSNIGVDPRLEISRLSIVSRDDGSYTISLSADANLSLEDVGKLCKKFGI